MILERKNPSVTKLPTFQIRLMHESRSKKLTTTRLSLFAYLTIFLAKETSKGMWQNVSGRSVNVETDLIENCKSR